MLRSEVMETAIIYVLALLLAAAAFTFAGPRIAEGLRQTITAPAGKTRPVTL